MNINLIKFDLFYYNSLPDKNNIIITTTGHYYTIISDDKKNKIGIVGCANSAKIEDKKFCLSQILIHPDYRGLDILPKSYNELVKKEKIDIIYATIQKENIASIKAHLKIGFKKISKKLENNLRNSNKLAKDNIRLFKIYN